MTSARGYAAFSPTAPMASYTFERRDPRADDVHIEILFSGVCHSDLHTARGEWDGLIYPNGTDYPLVPGHEIVGRVVSVGAGVSRFAPGDLVGVGTMVDSCGQCVNCRLGQESYCLNGATWTYNSPDRIDGTTTQGGYSEAIVVKQDFVFRITHSEEQLAAVAPLLCAGVTMWSPLRHWAAGPGRKVGVVGIGGLGHMGIKLARALGAHVVAFTTSESKRADALALGAHEVVNSRDAAAMAAHAGTLDLVLNSVAVAHDLDTYTSLLSLDGAHVLVGIPAEPHPSPSVANLIGGRRSLTGSLVGGTKETQEMLDFCAQHGIVADIEMIRLQDIETAFARMVKADVKYRFVIDMASIRNAA
jgi:uncharacterized zinc-type alcohol dehydrogenase-like protein